MLQLLQGQKSQKMTQNWPKTYISGTALRIFSNFAAKLGIRRGKKLLVSYFPKNPLFVANG